MDIPDTDSKRRIFISYGRADAEDLARQLAISLTERGHSVWLDREQMRSGRSWEEQIEQAILDHDVFIALLSPHAVRRPDGVCLDEISLARYSGRQIVPAMVVDCRPPLGIYRLDWVDFQQWQSPARYEQSLARLLEAVTAHGGQVIDGAHTDLFAQLRPLDFGVEVSRLTRNFTGRRWLFDELDRWLLRDDSRVFLLTGDPGTGKSAIMAQLQHTHPDVAACHFCVASYGDSLDPGLFVRSLAAQLASQLPDYREALAATIGNHTSTDSGTAMRRLIAGPLSAVTSERPLMIVLDALDEALACVGSSNIATVLHDGLDNLPTWLRLVVSSRNEPELLDLFSRYAPHEIAADRKENLQDVLDYLDCALATPDVAERIATAGTSRAVVAATIAENGAGNFLYATRATEGIRTGQLDPAVSDAFPRGLVEMYRSFFERRFPGGDGYREIRPLLDVVCAARESLTAAQVARFVARDEWDVEQDLETVAVMFPRHEDRYRPYHKSVTDWLMGAAGHGRRFRVDIKSGHRRIAERLLASYRESNQDIFMLKYIPDHLTEAGLWDDLTTVLTDLEFIDARVREGMVEELLRDYPRALGVIPDAEPDRQQERVRAARIARYARDCKSVARGEADEIEIVPAVTPVADGVLEERRERIVADPSRLDRLRAFGRFVQVQARFFALNGDHPLFVVQQAFYQAADGPVTAAVKAVSAINCDTDLVRLDEESRPEFDPYPAHTMFVGAEGLGARSFELSADGRIMAEIDNDGRLVRWNLETGIRELIQKRGSDCGDHVTLDASGRTAVSIGEGTVRLWDFQIGRCLGKLAGKEVQIRVAAICPGGVRIATVNEKGVLRIWSADSRECLATVATQSPPGRFVAINITGNRVLLEYEDKSLAVWDVSNGTCIWRLAEFVGAKHSTVLCTDAMITKVAATNGNRTFRIHGIETGEPVRVFAGHRNWVHALALTADGTKVVSMGGESDISYWDVATGECERTVEGYPAGGVLLSVSADGETCVSGGTFSPMPVWDLVTGRKSRDPDHHSAGVTEIALTADRKRAVSGSGDKTLRIWDVETGTCLRVLEGHKSWVVSVAICAQDRYVVSAGRDGTLRVWEIATGRFVRYLDRRDEGFLAVAGDQTAARVVSAGGGKIQIWDVEKGSCLHTLVDGDDKPEGVTMSADGHWVVGSRNRTSPLEIWETESGRHIRTLAGGRAGRGAVKISGDGRRIISTDLEIHDLASGQLICQLPRPRLFHHAVHVSNDGRFAAAVNDEETFCIWNVNTSKCLHIVSEVGLRSSAVCFETGRLVYGAAAGTVRFGRLPMLD